MTPLPLIVVGAGSIGQRHIETAMASDAVDLCAIVEPEPGLRAQLEQRGLPGVPFLDAAPAHARAAIVATPTADHAATAMACLDRGMAVLVEKPIAHTLAAAQKLVAHARAKDLPLIVGHHRRCHPFLIAARDMMGDLGEPVGAQGLWSLRKHDSYYDMPWRTQPGAGPLLTNLSHEVDLLQFLMGDIAQVTALTSAQTRGLAVEDSATLAFAFGSGALGSFLMSDAGLSPWAFEAGTNENPAIAPSGQDYLRIIGTAGALSLPSMTRWQADGAPADWTNPLRCAKAWSGATVDPISAQLDRFARVAMGEEDTILCDATAGLSALAITLATAYAAQEGRPVRPHDVPSEFDGIKKDQTT